MTRGRIAFAFVLAGAFAAPCAAAQRPDSSSAARGNDAPATSCPVTEGFGLSLNVPGVARTDSAAAARPAGAPRLTLDTAYAIDVAERTWTRQDIEASVAAGVVGRTASGGRWNACAGARASLGQATLTIRRARGTVRLHLSLEQLAAAGRRATTDIPRR